MIKAIAPLLTVLLLSPATAAAAGAAGDAAEPPSPEVVTGALEQARAGETPFHLLVHCTDEKGNRSLEVFPGGVAIWTASTQVNLTAPERRALLDTLVEKGFATFEPSYGGKAVPESADRDVMSADEPAPQADSPDEGSPERAALRVRCRVVFESGGVSKTSIQQAQGEQSPQLLGLAAALLDRVEPLATERGIGADDLQDGLAKVASGELAPETFSLRFVLLPPAGSDAVGTIVRVERGVLTRRPYAPGRTLGDEESEDLDTERLGAVVKALRKAQVPAMPANLYAPHPIELEVKVLDHDRSVLARPFRGLSPEEKGATQKRFDTLVKALHEELVGGGGPTPGS